MSEDRKHNNPADSAIDSTIEELVQTDHLEEYTPVKKKRGILSILISIALNIIVVGYFVWKETHSGSFDGFDPIELSDIRPLFLLAGVACFLTAVWAETVKYSKMIMTSSGRFDRMGALNTVLIGKYTDNITPFGAGGQPFQIGYLHRRGYKAGASSAIPIAGFLMQQIAFVLIALVVFVVNHDIIASIDVLRIAAVVGLLLYSAIPLAIVVFAIFPRVISTVVGWGVSVLHAVRIVRDEEQARHSVTHKLEEYTASLRLMGTRPHFVLKTLVLSVIYQTAILSIPFFTLRAFGAEVDFRTIFTLTVYIYAAITVIPTPGNAGAAEGSFLLVFSALEGAPLFWAMLTWRALVYYAWIAIGIVVSTKSAVSNRLPRKKPVPTEGALNIAEVIDIYYPTIDGVVRTVDAYARLMTQKGHSVTVICPRDPGRDDSAFPYDVFSTRKIHIPGFKFEVPWPLPTKREIDLAKRASFDVIHAHSPFMLGSIAVTMGRRLNIPVVATFHSKYYDDALRITHSKFLASIVMNIVVDFYCKADCVWACSATTADTLRSYGYRGEVQVMDNGVDPAPAEPPEQLRDLARAKLGVPGGKKTLLFVGQQIWHKNLRLVLDASAALKRRGGDYLTVITGEGYDAHAIKAYSDKLGLGDRVIFTGKISDRKLLFGLYECADLFFFPSLYDNAPLVLREAAMTGLPALLIEGSNAAEVVSDGVNGFTGPNDPEGMADKIESIFSRGDLSEVGLNAKATIPVLWNEIVDRVVRSYRDNFPTDIGG
ncbi:MAG: flippase-like domain-containing protein [Clostridia bacterium]|nr:flippase-like domain-containing protein [Clostridia bacterium]